MLHGYAHQIALTVKNLGGVAQPFPPLPAVLDQWTHEHSGHGSMANGSHHDLCLNVPTMSLGIPPHPGIYWNALSQAIFLQ